MNILLTNDDGIYAPGLAALERELLQLGEVTVTAPVTEQSGVGHSITYLTPLIAHEIYDRPGQQTERRRGWAVEGSPADCVKLGVGEFCSERPDLVVSGINSGLNAGINILYSGTVAAAIEGAFYGITSVAVSLEWDEHMRYAEAAKIARQMIEQIVESRPQDCRLFNLNIPTEGVKPSPEVRVVPAGLHRYGEHFERRQDPRGRNYYWATGFPKPDPGPVETDLTALRAGYVTLSPLHFDLTHESSLDAMKNTEFRVD
ncbi:MAG: 5'/3'-nucleotidase SurE [Pirellulales bacterium]|nr:5'/3'-nucleotidase SurE [Pirellulales bacterium]